MNSDERHVQDSYRVAMRTYDADGNLNTTYIGSEINGVRILVTNVNYASIFGKYSSALNCADKLKKSEKGKQAEVLVEVEYYSAIEGWYWKPYHLDRVIDDMVDI